VSRRAALLFAAAIACGPPPAPVAAPSVEQQQFAAAQVVLECAGTGGRDCLHRTDAARAWLALGQLELLATVPAPVVGTRLLSAYDRIRTGNEAGRRLAALLEAARPIADDLSCRPTTSAAIGADMRRRREELIDIATNLGLATTPLSSVVAELDAVATGLDPTFLVVARCRRGDLFVLLAPPATATETALDDAPTRSRPDGGWRPVALAPARGDLERGAPLGPRDPAPPIDDAPAADGIDPWIPVGEVDL